MSATKRIHLAYETREQWISLLELATREVFQLMLATDVTAAPPEMQTPQGLTAMVGLAGQLCGVLSLHCGERAAALMTSKMLGITPENVSTELSDAVGEISNMVAGNFKNKIPGLGDGCMLSPPTVVIGTDYAPGSVADKPTLEIRLLFEAMPMVITLEIHS